MSRTFPPQHRHNTPQPPPSSAAVTGRQRDDTAREHSAHLTGMDFVRRRLSTEQWHRLAAALTDSSRDEGRGDARARVADTTLFGSTKAEWSHPMTQYFLTIPHDTAEEGVDDGVDAGERDHR